MTFVRLLVIEQAPSIRIVAMRPAQTMRLGIPGSTATVFAVHVSGSRENRRKKTKEITAELAAGGRAPATAHMAQHFAQP